MDKKKGKFLELLSQQINSGSDKFNFETLSGHFNDAVKSLPAGELREVLLKQTEEDADKLWSLLKKSKKILDEELVLFHTFNEESRDETLKNISNVKSPKKQLHHLVQFGLSHPSKNIFDLLLDAEQRQNTNESKLEVLTKVTELCCRLTVGCNNSEVLLELMHFFLGEIGKIYDEFTESSNQPGQSWPKVKDLVLGFLTHCHMKKRQKEQHDNDNNSLHMTEYLDLLSAILSLYIDVLVMYSDRDESTLDHVSYMVYLLLRDSPSHILDTVNQISSLNENTVELLLPFLRKVLTSTATCTPKFECYLKYICATRKILKLLQNKNKDLFSIRKVVDKVLPDEGLLDWISDKSDSLITDLHLSGIPRNKMTAHLLKINLHDDSIEENLLDLILGENERKKREINLIAVESGVTGQEEKDSNALFFVDSQGSSELLEESQEGGFSNSKDDRMLRKQIDAMLERLERDSDDEDNEIDYDINFDKETSFNETLGENTTKAVSPQPENLSQPDQSLLPAELSAEHSDEGVVAAPEETEGTQTRSTRAAKQNRRNTRKTVSSSPETENQSQSPDSSPFQLDKEPSDPHSDEESATVVPEEAKGTQRRSARVAKKTDKKNTRKTVNLKPDNQSQSPDSSPFTAELDKEPTDPYLDEETADMTTAVPEETQMPTRAQQKRKNRKRKLDSTKM